MRPSTSTPSHAAGTSAERTKRRLSSAGSPTHQAVTRIAASLTNSEGCPRIGPRATHRHDPLCGSARPGTWTTASPARASSTAAATTSRRNQNDGGVRAAATASARPTAAKASCMRSMRYASPWYWAPLATSLTLAIETRPRPTSSTMQTLITIPASFIARLR